MGEETKIAWTDSTFNPWIGCSKVSAGCANCYAEVLSRRFGKDNWGKDAARSVTSESYWENPLKWDRAAARAGVRRRVFCGSMCDVFEDRADLAVHRVRLFLLIQRTPNLDWLLLTKRPEHAFVVLASSHLDPCSFANVWLGVSVENQRHGLPRLDVLREIPAAVRFVSVEPLLEDLGTVNLTGIDWVIVGGESGPHARPFDLAWARSLRDQCQAAVVPFFMKQVGANPGTTNHPLGSVTTHASWKPHDSHGADPAEWPEDLRIREVPS